MYQMAAYCRLSKDDGENKISESIENQMKLIREYVGKSNDLEIADIYIDDGYSGLYFANRLEFQRMMEDIYKGKIQGVITKDISRLGREHIETSNYIERVFPSLGVRYIAILDGVDSVHHSNEELAQFKTLFNDMYSRDISKKIRGAFSAHYTGSFLADSLLESAHIGDYHRELEVVGYRVDAALGRAPVREDGHVSGGEEVFDFRVADVIREQADPLGVG